MSRNQAGDHRSCGDRHARAGALQALPTAGGPGRGVSLCHERRAVWKVLNIGTNAHARHSFLCAAAGKPAPNSTGANNGDGSGGEERR
jgi:hypothetical protein